MKTNFKIILSVLMAFQIHIVSYAQQTFGITSQSFIVPTDAEASCILPNNTIPYVLYINTMNINWPLSFGNGITNTSGVYDCTPITTTTSWSLTQYVASGSSSLTLIPTPTLTLSSNVGKNIEIGNLPASVSPYYFDLGMTVAGSAFVQRFIVYDTKPINFSLVLDVSGSMGSLANPTVPGISRLDLLKSASAKFLNYFSIFSNSTTVGNTNNIVGFDSLGIVYFTGNVTSVPTISSLLPLLADSDPLVDCTTSSCVSAFINNINNQIPQNSTGMGAGVLAGILQLYRTTATPKQHIILFTDGMQNSPLPLIYGTTGGVVFTGGGSIPAALSSFITMDAVTSLNSIKISTIGLGQTNGDFFPNLNRIATATGGYHNSVSFTDPSQLDNSFLFALTQILRGSSPQVTELFYNTIGASGSEESFIINKKIDKVIFDLTSYEKASTSMTNVGQSVSFTIEKDGKDLTQYGKLITGSGYRSLVFSLPFKVSASESITSDGTWKLKITGKQGTAYKTLALVNDHALKYVPAIGGANVTGSPIDLSVKLKWHLTPITNATVTAIVLKPGQDLGNLLATTSLSKDAKAFALPTDLSVGYAKLLELLKRDPTLLAKLTAEKVLVELVSNPDGTYAGQYPQTDKTGSYQIIFRIEGESPELGHYIRTEMQSTVIELSSIDYSKSEPSKTIVGDTIKIVIRPRSTNGLFLGPDYANRISITVGLASAVVQSPIDNGDGSYTFIITGIPTGANPPIQVNVLGNNVYDGSLNSYGNIGWPWWVWLIIILFIVFLLYLLVKKYL